MNLSHKLKIGLLSCGLAALTACDTPGNIELASTEYEGRAKIRLVQHVGSFGSDAYTLEVQDSTGTVIAYMTAYTEPRARLNVDGKTYDLADKGFKVIE